MCRLDMQRIIGNIALSLVWTGHLVDLLVAGPGQRHDDGSGGAELHALHRGGHVAVCTPVQHLELSCPAPCHAQQTGHQEGQHPHLTMSLLQRPCIAA